MRWRLQGTGGLRSTNPALIVSEVNDTAIIGGFEEAGRDRAAGHKVVGLRVVGISTTPHAVQAPPPPSSLVDAQKALSGPRTEEDGCCSRSSSIEEFPKYVLLQKPPTRPRSPSSRTWSIYVARREEARAAQGSSRQKVPPHEGVGGDG